MKGLLSTFKPTEKIPLRLAIIAATLVLLVINYFMMYFDYLTFFESGELVFFKKIENTGVQPDLKKISVFHIYFSKFIRLVLNDLLSVVLLFMIFFDRKVLRVSIFVISFNALILFPVVSFLLVNFPVTTRSITSPLHFIIMNPVLVFLLVPFFFIESNKSVAD